MKKFTTYIEEKPVVEMATMNLATPSSGALPSNKYKVQMYSNDHNPPHVHVIYDDHNVEFYIESGEFYKFKKNSKELSPGDLKRLTQLVKTWLFDMRRHNRIYQQICFDLWVTWFGDDGFSKEFIKKMSE